MTRDRFAGLAAEELATPKAPEPAAPPTKTLPERNLGGRVPDPIFREFSRQKSATEEALQVRKVTTEQGLEALVRMLRREDVWTAWLEEVEAVRREYGVQD